MGIFSRKTSAPPSTDGLILDRTWDDQELDAAYAALRDGDLDSPLAAFKQQTNDPDRRAVWTDGLSEAAIGRSEQLEARLEQAPGDPELLLLLAQTLVKEGWEVRTGAQAKYVTEQRFATFQDILVAAKEVVEAAIDAAPDDATPWTVYQWVAIGLGAKLPVHQQLLAEATDRHPDSYAAHTSYIHASAPKWYGTSIEELLDFAAQASDRARPGSVLGTVITDAVIEARLYIMSFSEESSTKRIGKLAKLSGQWQDPLIESRAKWLHPDRHREAPDLMAHNKYAYVLKKLAKTEARASADAMFGRVSRVPWGYQGAPLEEFAKVYR
ncbi:hypothetical protein E1263_02610 [Kribbella antibiotica]|uniref:DUF4034 domain-containing protein n=1 Tax=Kribbella antibiotica TaxID=190195 RepID=A0A4V2YQP7_9ACTN|nr:hypothetical protein [Kribbella antibiotica]TDD62917.1 hypothetical protein E1263_02610 [Kribbella antibiotica]